MQFHSLSKEADDEANGPFCIGRGSFKNNFMILNSDIDLQPELC